MDGIESLEKHCEEPGLWLIEGVQVRKARGRNGWIVVFEPGVRSEWAPSFVDAQRLVVDAINAGVL